MTTRIGDRPRERQNIPLDGSLNIVVVLQDGKIVSSKIK